MIDSLLAVMVLTVLAAAALAMYLLPVLVGWVRHVPDIGSVAVINILLGWTLAGWAIALALALRSVSPASPAAQTLPPGRPWPAPLPPGPVPPAGWPGWPGARAPRHDPPPLLLPPRPPGPWGSPQGALLSPLLASVYLHYVLDLWADWWRKHHAHGDVIIVRWADDFIVGFEHRMDAEKFLAGLRERFAKFGLELHPAKTRLIEFGRFAATSRARRGLGKPETFDFLGFTHICARSKNGRFWLKRITISKRMRAKLKAVKDQLRQRMHEPVPEQGRWLAAVVRGHMNYYAVPGNLQAVAAFRDQVVRHWLKTLRRRGQKTRTDWARMHRIATRWLPPARVMHPFPQARFAATHPR